jgi:hypothetical protein
MSIKSTEQNICVKDQLHPTFYWFFRSRSATQLSALWMIMLSDSQPDTASIMVQARKYRFLEWEVNKEFNHLIIGAGIAQLV